MPQNALKRKQFMSALPPLPPVPCVIVDPQSPMAAGIILHKQNSNQRASAEQAKSGHADTQRGYA